MALDVPELDQATELARRLEGEVGCFKVGLELFGGHGPAAVERIGTYGPVFLDLKLHDIPTTVERSARRLGRLGVTMLTVHGLGGPTMVTAAVAGLADGAKGAAGPTPMILAVTVLTSMSDDELDAVCLPSADQEVPALARMATQAGAPGLVCAPADLARVRAAVGEQPTLVTPGVRPAGAGSDDHARGATPSAAVQAGADYLVVGRPITRAADPVAAVRSILAELQSAPDGP